MSQLPRAMVLSPTSEILDEASEGANKAETLSCNNITVPTPTQQIKNTLPSSYD